jgi:hypothetical protein
MKTCKHCGELEALVAWLKAFAVTTKHFRSVCCDSKTYMEVGGVGHTHHCDLCKRELGMKDMYVRADFNQPTGSYY